ncbi:MAG: DUF3047 domain-containing protein [Nitrospiraceae bacterium]|nr:DUF3047 domain-containing protein [Nitrospiraceae bacterium]
MTPWPVLAAGDGPREVGPFSVAPPGATVPAGWKPLTFNNIGQHTKYVVVRDGDAVVIKADSQAAASGLIKEVNIDPREYPIVRWRWKVENVLVGSDVRRKDGDDYPARLYITFQYEPDKVSVTKKLKYKAGRILFGDIPIAAINYIWDTRTPVGTLVGNVYTDFAQMIVVESGRERLRRWVNEERNVYEDYKRAFGGEPPRINGVAIMTDTDNTKEQATAYYGDITFVKE